MKRIKPDDNLDYNTVQPSKRSSYYFQHPVQRSPSTYLPYRNERQNYMYDYGGNSSQIPPPPSSPWLFQNQPPLPSTPPLPRTPPPPPNRHSLVFDPTQPPPHFSENRNSPGPGPSPSSQNKIILPPLHSPTGSNQLMLHHPVRMRGRGRNQYRGSGVIGSFDRGGRMRIKSQSHSPHLLFNNGQQSQLNGQNYTDFYDDSFDENQTIINKKNKRKPMSTRYTQSKEWDREDAMKALNLEKEFNRFQNAPILILKFPDPDLNKYIVKKYSQSIETVHFQQASTPRSCFVQLKEGSNIEQVRKDLCEIPFGTGKLTAEIKIQNTEEGPTVAPEEIDPYTLYVGNLSAHINVQIVKEIFPKAARIDIGYAQRLKYTRYAFIRFNSIEDAIEGYKSSFNTLIENRSVIVRFRRAKGNIGLPGESKIPNPRKIPLPTAKKPEPVLDNTTLDNRTLDNKSPTKDKNMDPIISTDADDSTSNDFSIDTDTKDNVLLDAEKLLADASPPESDDSSEPPSIVTSPTPEIKIEEKDSNSAVPDYSLLGTRIKDEPLDDEDELLAQAECFEDDDTDDDEFDCEPEEEDDFGDNAHSGRLIKPKTNEKAQKENLEEFRQIELTREEQKPDINSIFTLPNNNLDTTSNAILPDPFARKPTDRDNISLSNGIKYDDNLDDLFRSMNPEENDEYDF